MKIVNSIMPMSDVEALAANGQKLRVAVTKTSAQGEAAQSTTPNLMSFSTDENSIWFNGKKYGATLFKDVFGLSTSSSNSQIVTALGGYDFSTISLMVNRGILFLNINNKALQHVMIRVENTGSSEGDYLHIQGFSDASDTAYIKIRHYNGVFNVPRAAQRNNIVFRTDIMDEFAPLSNYPLSANMGMKLNDEKLAKTDVVNSLSDSSTNKALSAAQGKALNDKISALGSVYRIKGSKTNISEVLALTDAKVGDVWNVINAFTLNGKPFPASTNVVCLVATSTSDHDENNWDPIGGTVDLSPYAKKTEVEESDNKILEQLGAVVNKDEIVNNLTSTDANKPLSAAMGKKLNDEKLAKTDVVNNLTTTDTTKALSAAQGKALNDKLSSNKISINFSAINNTSDSATIKGYMGNLDGTALVTKLTYGATLIDSSSEDWVITPQEVSASKVVFVGLKLQLFRIATKTITVTISGSNYTNMAVITADRYVPNVVNNLTSSDTANALSAAQGKALNDRISGLGNVYRVKGTKTNLSDVLALTDAKVGDVWNVTNAFTLGGKPYPANTNVVCIAATSSSDHDEGNWDPLGGTVDLSTYVPKSDIVDNLSTSDSKKPLSAKQGLALATMITELEDNKETYQLLKTLKSGTLSTQSEIDAILGPYSSFNAALNAGKVIHGVYKDDINRMNTVAFSAFNDTTNSRVRMFAILNGSTLLYIQATYSGTNWTSATTSEESFSASITIE
jgi:hypothetical protein